MSYDLEKELLSAAVLAAGMMIAQAVRESAKVADRDYDPPEDHVERAMKILDELRRSA